MKKILEVLSSIAFLPLAIAILIIGVITIALSTVYENAVMNFRKRKIK